MLSGREEVVDQMQGIGRRLSNEECMQRLGRQQFIADIMLQQAEERVIEPIDVEECNRLTAALQLVGSHHLEDLVECAYTAREGDKSIGLLDESLLTS